MEDKLKVYIWQDFRLRKWICAICQIPRGIFVIDSVLHSIPSCGTIKTQSCGIRKERCNFRNRKLAKATVTPADCGFCLVCAGSPARNRGENRV